MRDLSRSPLSRRGWSCRTRRPAAVAAGAPGRVARGDDRHREARPHPLAQETARGIEAALEYATDLFDATTIARMAGHLTTLLEGIGPNPHGVSRARPAHGGRARAAREVERHRHRVSAGHQHPRRLRGAGRATPDAVAVSCGDAELTYRELNHRGDQLARRLRRAGVRSEAPVGLLLPRSPEMVVPPGGAQGGRRVRPARPGRAPGPPGVDARRRPGAPRRDARAVAGGVAAGDPRAPAGARGRRNRTGGRRAPGGAGPTDRRGQLAYVMYTSGSTGRPKGVCVIHRGVVRLVKQASYARLTADEVLLQLAPTAFDASTFEIWGALLNGGRLVVFPRDRPSFSELEDVIRRGRVTTLWLTAGLFNAVIEARPQALASLRQLLVGGEALSVPHVQKALAELPGVAIINGYGPTEGTTFTCCFAVTGAAGLASIPIGLPIANTTAHVLDRHLAPVPVGVPGELYAGGDGIARGYLSRPSSPPSDSSPTRSRPIPRPASTGPAIASVASRTVTWSFSGASTSRSKSAAIASSWGDRGALSCTPRCGLRGGRGRTRRRPAALRVSSLGEAVTAAALRGHLRRRSRITWSLRRSSLEALPLTRSGKVDGRSPPFQLWARRRRRAFVAPRTPGGAARGHLGRGAAARQGRRPRRLLRAGRSLADHDAGDRPARLRVRRRAAAAGALRGADGGAPVRAHRRRPARGPGARPVPPPSPARRATSSCRSPSRSSECGSSTSSSRAARLQHPRRGAPHRPARRARARPHP